MKKILVSILALYSLHIFAQGSGDLVLGIPQMSNCYQKVTSALVADTSGMDTVFYNFLDHPSGRVTRFGTAENNPLDMAGWDVVLLDDNSLLGYGVISWQGQIPVNYTTEIPPHIDRIIATPISTQTQTNLASIHITFISPDSSFNIAPVDDHCFTYDNFKFHFETFLSGLCKNPTFVLHLADDTLWEQSPMNSEGFPIQVYTAFNGGPNVGNPLNPDSLCDPPVVIPPGPEQPYPRCTDFTLEVILSPCDEFSTDPRCPLLNIPYPIEICCMCDLEFQPENE